MHEVRIPVSTSILSLPAVFTFIIYWLCHVMSFPYLKLDLVEKYL